MFAVAIPVCVIRLRLFFLQKTKLKRVNPEGALCTRLEFADYKKKHIKVVLISGIVAIRFIFCMSPTSFLFPYEIINDTTASQFYQSLSIVAVLLLK